MRASAVPVPAIYYDPQFKLDAAKILPGEYFVTDRDMLIVTVLGSCVSACIQDATLGIGGMNHFMLPENRQADVGPLSESARYGSYAMEMLINQIIKAGGRRERLKAKIFGGGQVVKSFVTSNVGEQNAVFARHYLETERIPIVAADLLDVFPRKVYFFPRTGKVMVKKLRSVHNDTIARREREYGARLREDDIGGDVELF